MRYIKTEWTPTEAEEWTKEDTITVIISPLVYILILIGGALSALLIPEGFVALAAGIALMVLMIRIIDPKLSAISRGYEIKQKHYLEELEKKMKWED